MNPNLKRWHQGKKFLSLPTITAVNWSPPFQAPFLVNTGSGSYSSNRFYYPHDRQDDIEAFQSYIEAIRHLKQGIEADHAIFEKKLAPGTAVIFDNRRIVHARRAFENQGGKRWLRGAYIDTDVFRSRLRILEEESQQSRQSQTSQSLPDLRRSSASRV